MSISLENMQFNTETTYIPAFPIDSLTMNSLLISIQKCILKYIFLVSSQNIFCGPIELKHIDR